MLLIPVTSDWPGFNRHRVHGNAHTSTTKFKSMSLVPSPVRLELTENLPAMCLIRNLTNNGQLALELQTLLDPVHGQHPFLLVRHLLPEISLKVHLWRMFRECLAYPGVFDKTPLLTQSPSFNSNGRDKPNLGGILIETRFVLRYLPI